MEEIFKMMTKMFVKFFCSVYNLECPSCCTIIKNLFMEKHSHEKEHIYIGREDDKNILSYIGFSRLSIFIKKFSELSTIF